MLIISPVGGKTLPMQESFTLSAPWNICMHYIYLSFLMSYEQISLISKMHQRILMLSLI
jgi:hypothetical protein